MYCKRKANFFAAMNVIRVHLFVRTFTKEILFEPLDNMWLVLKSMFALIKLHYIGASMDKNPKNSLISIYTVRVGVHNRDIFFIQKLATVRLPKLANRRRVDSVAVETNVAH